VYSFNSNKKNTLQPENLNTDLAISMFQWLQAWVCKSVFPISSNSHNSLLIANMWVLLYSFMGWSIVSTYCKTNYRWHARW